MISLFETGYRFWKLSLDNLSKKNTTGGKWLPVRCWHRRCCCGRQFDRRRLQIEHAARKAASARARAACQHAVQRAACCQQCSRQPILSLLPRHGQQPPACHALQSVRASGRRPARVGYPRRTCSAHAGSLYGLLCEMVEHRWWR